MHADPRYRRRRRSACRGGLFFRSARGVSSRRLPGRCSQGLLKRTGTSGRSLRGRPRRARPLAGDQQRRTGASCRMACGGGPATGRDRRSRRHRRGLLHRDAVASRRTVRAGRRLRSRCGVWRSTRCGTSRPSRTCTFTRIRPSDALPPADLIYVNAGVRRSGSGLASRVKARWANDFPLAAADQGASGLTGFIVDSDQGMGFIACTADERGRIIRENPSAADVARTRSIWLADERAPDGRRRRFMTPLVLVSGGGRDSPECGGRDARRHPGGRHGVPRNGVLAVGITRSQADTNPNAACLLQTCNTYECSCSAALAPRLRRDAATNTVHSERCLTCFNAKALMAGAARRGGGRVFTLL